MQEKNVYRSSKPGSLALVAVCIVAVLSVAAMGIKPEVRESVLNAPAVREAALTAKDSLASKAAFMDVYKVLMSPRCMNCHPKGDAPLQGDDSHVHTMDVTRGTDGKGLYAMKCTNCHQAANTPGPNMPPGNVVWHLPPADMPMVFEGRTPAELAAQLKDPDQNGHKTLQQLIEHVSHDKLVLWGWNPGEGRTKPPLAHAVFAQRFKEWVTKGAVIPD